MAFAGTGVLVETLLERGAEGDLAEAQEAIDRLANLPADEGSAMRDITLLRLRALLARARGDDVAYRDLVNRYRAMAESLGFEGHIAWAEAMIEGGDTADGGARMTAGVACGSCGTGLRENAKFCDECGAPTAVSVDTAEYKQVTVLFADVVRSMDIAAAVDMERLREIMTELVERSAAVVQRYGGTVEYTGDGVMAIFGAPVALEDHAFRACLAALAIQEEANRLAAEVQRRDGVALRLRVGLNSGRVIAGEIGSGSLGYAATGEPVGFAQRMESVAPPGGVMLSESTARLVEHTVMLAEPEWVHIKGADEPVRARRLVAIGPRDGLVGRAEASLVGRRWEMAALDAMVDRTIGGRGGVVNVVGPPGIGKSRVAREAAALAAGRGVEVFWTFCESHARDIPFHAVTRLLRAGSGVADLDGEAARARVREQVPDADPQDLLLLDDLLGIADPDVPLPQIDPDARRRRLTALINTASLARTEPALFIIEDAHWIDAVSESMLADFLTVIPRTPSMVLITSRPEYEGALTRVHGAQTIALAPLGDSDTAALLGELLGSDPSVGELAAIIAERAAGNPFFAEEMVRELVQRGVLTGERGGYVCRADVAEVARAGHGAGGHRGAHRPAEHPGQADVERGVGDRRPLRGRAARRAGHRCGVRRAAQRGADRSGAVHPERRVRLPPPADPRGGLRIAAEIRSRRVAPAPGRRDRSSVSPAVGRGECRADRRTPGGRRRAARRVRLAHARRNVGDQPRHRRGAAKLGARPQRSPTHCPPTTPTGQRCASRPRTMLCGIAWRVRAVERGRRPLRGIAGVVHRRRGQGVAGHRHGRAGDRSRVPGPDPRGVAAGIGSQGPHRVDRRSDVDGGAVLPGDLRQGSQRRVVVTCCGGRRRVIDLADGDPSKGQLHFRVSVGDRLGVAGYRPVLPGSSRMAQTTCATAWPWPAAPTRCPTPRSSPTSTSREYRWACWLPMIRRCARSRMRYGLPNDPVTIWRWSSPGRRWALRWCTATRMRSVTADRSCWPRSATCSCAGDTT